MELELQTDYLNCYNTLLETTICQEETMESIVPDACPDILYIVDTEATVYLASKEMQDGRVALSGTLGCDVLYCPDGAAGIRHLHTNIPFTCQTEAVGGTGPYRILALARVQSSDTRSLNPRKVLTRVTFGVEITVMAAECTEICTNGIAEEKAGIAQLIEETQTYVVTAVEEKPFTFSDDLTMANVRQPVEELLKTRVNLVCNEAKVIGNKLIFKGEATLQILYRDGAGAVCPGRFELPFSQIMEIAGVEEGAVSTVDVILNQCTCELDNSEGHILSVNLAMLAQAVVRETRQVKILADAYSTEGITQPEWRHYKFHQLVAQEVRRANMREMIETTTPVREVCDVHVQIGQMTRSATGCQVGTMVTVLFWGEDGALASVTKELTAACGMELPDGCEITWRCKSMDEGFATPVGGGLEVRYTVELQCLALIPQSTTGIARLTWEERREEGVAGPSIVLRMVGAGERLWDVAKAYGTTMDDIIQANGLSEDVLPMGELLLIPKKR